MARRRILMGEEKNEIISITPNTASFPASWGFLTPSATIKVKRTGSKPLVAKFFAIDTRTKTVKGPIGPIGPINPPSSNTYTPRFDVSIEGKSSIKIYPKEKNTSPNPPIDEVWHVYIEGQEHQYVEMYLHQDGDTSSKKVKVDVHVGIVDKNTNYANFGKLYASNNVQLTTSIVPFAIGGVFKFNYDTQIDASSLSAPMIGIGPNPNSIIFKLTNSGFAPNIDLTQSYISLDYNGYEIDRQTINKLNAEYEVGFFPDRQIPAYANIVVHIYVPKKI